MPTPDPKSRFADRVADYVKYRPTYPPDFLDIFRSDMGLRPHHVIADIGSGTGISTQPFLENGNTVYAIEPNPQMRAAAEHVLAPYTGSGTSVPLSFPRTFHSLDASAEQTTLPDHSVDFVLCAQAFHWFDRSRARAEFSRILRPTGYVVLMWNNRQLTGSPFLERYESLLNEFGTDYAKVNHANLTPTDLANFLGPHMQTRTLPNHQHFPLEGLLGRAFSSSYTPPPTHPNHQKLKDALTTLFHETQKNGQVTMTYTTEIHFAPAH